MTSIYLIRHAQAEGNLAQRFQGRTDTPLTDLGQKQAVAVAGRLSALPLDAVYTSPLTRAKQTAQAIAKFHHRVPIEMPGLIEIDGGPMEDRPFSEILAEYPKEFHQFDKEPHLFEGIEGGESIVSVYTRMVRAIGEIADRHPDETVAVVSHGCAIRCYLCFARAYPLEQLGSVEWGRNTGVTHVVYTGKKILLLRANDVSHLPEELLTGVNKT